MLISNGSTGHLLWFLKLDKQDSSRLVQLCLIFFEMDTESIKERLNLHVKRRLASDGGRDAVRPKIAITTAVSAKPTPTKTKVIPISSTKTNKSPKKVRMSKKTISSSSESMHSTISLTSVTTTPSRQSTSSTLPSTTTSFVPPTRRTPTTPQPANNNNEGEHDHDRAVEKHPDILTMVLNEKKLQLMRDPDVLVFLSNIIGLYNVAKMSK